MSETTNAPIDRLTRLEVMVACRDLSDRYALAVNSNDVDAFVALFTDDAMWERPGMALNGPGEIRAFIAGQFSQARHVRHLNGHCVVDVIDADTGLVRSATTVYEMADTGEGVTNLPPPALIAEYETTMVRRGEAWKIHRHKAVVRCVSEHSLGLPGVSKPR